MIKKRGFTLIELLVVIAVIAVLMGILMPALQKAKSQAKRTICMSRIKQTGMAMHMYAEAWDGSMLPYTDTGGNKPAANPPMPWFGVVCYSRGNTTDGKFNPLHLAILYEQKMIENPEVFYCPAQLELTNYPFPYNYEYYANIGQGWGSYVPGAFEQAGHTFVRSSYNYWTHDKQKLSSLAQYPILVDNLQEWEVIPHRSGEKRPTGVSALFGDGHANFCSGTDIFDEELWAREEGWYNGPGNKPQLFEELLRIIRLGYQ